MLRTVGYHTPIRICGHGPNLIFEAAGTNWKHEQYREKQMQPKSDPYQETQRTQQRDPNHGGQAAVDIAADEFISRSRYLFGDRFNYSGTQFRTWRDQISVKCTHCDDVFEVHPQKHIESGYCNKCGVPSGRKELIEFVRSLGVETRINDRSALGGQELDVYVPQYNLGIEYHGAYWHSHAEKETTEKKYRHQRKALACVEKNVSLLQIFDFEWASKRPIVESMIRNACDQSYQIPADDLQLTTINNRATKLFMEDVHLRGHRHAKTALALTRNDEIMMAASFKRHKDGYEIIRLATRCGYQIEYGVSRILNSFLAESGGVLYAFADLRYSSGRMYEKLGFQRLKVTQPGYFYIKQVSPAAYIILSRKQCQKHKLPMLLDAQFSAKKTESENMFNAYYRRIWTPGSILYCRDRPIQ